MAGAAKYISIAGKLFYPSLLWNMAGNSKTIYFTFDDGPIPGITPWVLSLLNEYNAKATFFSIGENISKNPATFQKIIADGHSIGNHTFNHLNGWKTSLKVYLENVLLAEAEIKKYYPVEKSNTRKSLETGQNKPNLKLFRPPYGKITPTQIKSLQGLGYRIVMWDVISFDFANSNSVESCYYRVIDNAKPGSIVVFHDSLKASKNLKVILPKLLEYYQQKGYEFRSL